nr:unnamed protein product [Callosobruchus analis]CAI5841875.1 unnamed protein product [Callosobruchus analis]
MSRYEYASSKGILTETRSDFRKGYSTASALLKVTDYNMRSLDSGLTTALVLLDFTRASETLDSSRLLARLHHFGVDEM